MGGAPAETTASVELFKAVGSRVRALRLERGLTLDELSARSGVSRRMITLLEAGQSNASLGTLDKLAWALGTGFGSLVATRQPVPLVPAKPAHVAPIWEDEQGSSARLLLSDAGVAQVEIWRWDLAGGAGYAAEADPPGSEELVLVAAGDVSLEVGGDRFVLGAGSYARVPTDRGCRYSNPGAGPASFFSVMLLPGPDLGGTSGGGIGGGTDGGA